MSSSQTDRRIVVAAGALARVGEVFRGCFGGAGAFLVADENTFAAAGRAVADSLRQAGVEIGGEWIFPGRPVLPATSENVDSVRGALEPRESIAVAIGSGTINDLTKLAAHRCGRSYLAVATAASMDGYAASGASITHDGVKRTFDCPPPRAIVADLDVLGAAPRWLAAAGYGDLLAKITAGADWILADALGVEPIDPTAWEIVQPKLRNWLELPLDVGRLIEGLLASGLAMQVTRTSRPASGAEHQFSHLWDMQHASESPHGFKVAVGTVASASLYERLLEMNIQSLDIERLVQAWPTWAEYEPTVAALHDQPALREAALVESRAKHATGDELAARLRRLVDRWPDLYPRLHRQLLSCDELRQMLQTVGAPSEPGMIGISPASFQGSFRAARSIRRRYTILDLIAELGMTY